MFRYESSKDGHKYFNSQTVSDYMIKKIFNLESKNKTLWEK